MNESLHLHPVIILLAAAVFAVALFRRCNASPMLGYLCAGAIVGPGGIGLIPDVAHTRDLSEFGVMFLLFVIGLELSWERLRDMRRQVFAVAFAQVIITTLLFTFALEFAGIGNKISLVIGGALALSSTAMVMQLLEDKNQNASAMGRLALTVLLVQDLAAVPLLVIIPAFSNPDASLLNELATLGGKAVLALGAIFLVGRLLLGRLYRAVASLDNAEVFTALTLLLVLGTGYLTHQAGLSLPLGAFMAGLLMAETEYRHQVEADVLPYKGLFMGLFFMAIGMSVDLATAWNELSLIFVIALGIMSLKASLIIVLCRFFSLPFSLAVQTGLLLSQGGEFAFIVFRLASDNGLLPPHWSQIITIAVTVTMVLTPLAILFGEQFARRSEHRRRRGAEDLREEMTDIKNHVIILGFGRVGQTIAKLLSAEDIPYIAIDSQVSTVLRARKIGLPVYYGDGSRREVLQALGVERAQAAIITLNNAEAAERAVRGIRMTVASLPIIARAHDLKDVLALEAAGADLAVSEMFEASLQLGGSLLKSLGIGDREIARITEIFRDRDYAMARGTLEVPAVEAKTPLAKITQFQHPETDSTPIKNMQGSDI